MSTPCCLTDFAIREPRAGPCRQIAPPARYWRHSVRSQGNPETMRKRFSYVTCTVPNPRPIQNLTIPGPESGNGVCTGLAPLGPQPPAHSICAHHWPNTHGPGARMQMIFLEERCAAYNSTGPTPLQCYDFVACELEITQATNRHTRPMMRRNVAPTAPEAGRLLETCFSSRSLLGGVGPCPRNAAPETSRYESLEPAPGHKSAPPTHEAPQSGPDLPRCRATVGYMLL